MGEEEVVLGCSVWGARCLMHSPQVRQMATPPSYGSNPSAAPGCHATLLLTLPCARQDLAAQQRRVCQLENEVAVLAGAAAAAGVDVAGILRLAASAAPHPDLLRLEAAAAEAEAAAGKAGRGLDPAAAQVADATFKVAAGEGGGGAAGRVDAARTVVAHLDPSPQGGSLQDAEDQVKPLLR